MRTSETTKELFNALVEVQKEVKNLYKSVKKKINMKDGRTKELTYVPLDDVTEHLRGILPNRGLSYIQLCDGGDAMGINLSTRIIHQSGEWIESLGYFPMAEVAGANKIQNLGAAITYAKRYMLCAAFGIAGEEDTDGYVEPQKQKPTITPKTLTDEQIAEIERLAEETGTSIPAMLQWFKVENLASLDYKKAKVILEKKIDANRAGKA
jgi:hypothetical protein